MSGFLFLICTAPIEWDPFIEATGDLETAPPTPHYMYVGVGVFGNDAVKHNMPITA